MCETLNFDIEMVHLLAILGGKTQFSLCSTELTRLFCECQQMLTVPHSSVKIWIVYLTYNISLFAKRNLILILWTNTILCLKASLVCNRHSLNRIQCQCQILNVFFTCFNYICYGPISRTISRSRNMVRHKWHSFPKSIQFRQITCIGSPITGIVL